MSLLIRGGAVDGQTVDLRIDDGVVDAMEPQLAPCSEDEVLEAGGAEVIPGLHDHHVHLRSLAASATSVSVGPPDIRTADDLRQRLVQAAGRSTGSWIRATGYHESVAGPLDRYRLDELVPGGTLLRVQHRSGGLWILNSVALSAIQLDGVDLPGIERDADGRPTGRLWRLDRWLATRVPSVDADVASMVARSFRFGVTGWTDADPTDDAGAATALASTLAGQPVTPRLCLMAPPGARSPGEGALLGPVKVMLDDDQLPSLEGLTQRVTTAHRGRRPVAVHCVTTVQLWLTLLALADAGALPGDRIEHGAEIPPEAFAPLRATGVVVVTQPNLVAERGDRYREEVPAEDLPNLWRLRSLLDAGVPVAAGTDAPFGDPDPWAAMRAAVSRTTLDGFVLSPEERVTPVTARALFFGGPETPHRPRVIRRGSVADLCVVEAASRPGEPVLDADGVRATVLDGDVVYRRTPS